MSALAEPANANRAPEQDDPARLRFVAGVDHQSGVLPYREGANGPEMVLITSRRTSRWVLPKGSVDPGMTPQEAAAQEALEEAGLVVTPGAPAIGSYRLPKIRPPLIWTVEVTLYPMPITEVLDDWLEIGQRQRLFVAPEDAMALLTDPEITDLVRGFWGDRITDSETG